MSEPALSWRMDDRLREMPLDPEAFAREVDRRVDEIATARSQPARLLAMLSVVAVFVPSFFTLLQGFEEWRRARKKAPVAAPRLAE